MTATRTRNRSRRDEILDAATRLFSEGGYRGTSTRAIAEAVGVSEAAIYRHYESKDGLYQAVIDRKASAHDITGFLEAEHGHEDIEAVLTRMAHHILGFRERDPQLLGLMFNNSVEVGPATAVLFHKIRLPYIHSLAKELKTRMASGEVREVDSYITSRCFVGMVMDCALTVDVWNKLTVFDFRANDVVRNNVPIFARGLQAQRDEVP